MGPYLLAFLSLVPAVAAAGALVARPAVVELYTSQGCSDCPPADALLGKLAARSDVLALSFHVDYWDRLGWRDRFALPAAKERQFAYVRRNSEDWVYTPQVVVDGTDSLVGGDAARIERLLVAPRAGVPVRIVVEAGELHVEVDATAGQPAAQVTLLSYLRQADTVIGNGENSGRTLREYNIVLSCATLGEWRGARASYRVPTASLPAGAERVAVLLQQVGPGQIIGAADSALPR
jgi:hypothetical protein